MSRRQSHAIVVSGTDTGIGKTVLCAALVHALRAQYWKPVQSGFVDGPDDEIVRDLANIDHSAILPGIYCLQAPVSPHLAAARDGVRIDANTLRLPQTDRLLIIEGAGGLMVPLNDTMLFIDVFARWQAPVLLAARTALGTINHTLLSLAMLRMRRVPIAGVVLIGDEQPGTRAAIEQFGQIRVLGCLPWLVPLTGDALHRAFAADIDLSGLSL